MTIVTTEHAQVPPTKASRIQGAVLGAAIGDAMGHPTEFCSMEQIRSTSGPDAVKGFELYWNRDAQRLAPWLRPCGQSGK